MAVIATANAAMAESARALKMRARARSVLNFGGGWWFISISDSDVGKFLAEKKLAKIMADRGRQTSKLY